MDYRPPGRRLGRAGALRVASAPKGGDVTTGGRRQVPGSSSALWDRPQCGETPLRARREPQGTFEPHPRSTPPVTRLPPSPVPGGAGIKRSTRAGIGDALHRHGVATSKRTHDLAAATSRSEIPRRRGTFPQVVESGEESIYRDGVMSS